MTFLVCVGAVATLLIVAGFLALVSGHRHLPLSERVCLRLLELAAWLDDLGSAWDGAILRYRHERQLTQVVMESTAERQSHLRAIEACEPLPEACDAVAADVERLANAVRAGGES
jgi:hypothetical protein